jgi:hypothetical protein
VMIVLRKVFCDLSPSDLGEDLIKYGWDIWFGSILSLHWALFSGVARISMEGSAIVFIRRGFETKKKPPLQLQSELNIVQDRIVDRLSAIFHALLTCGFRISVLILMEKARNSQPLWSKLGTNPRDCAMTPPFDNSLVLLASAFAFALALALICVIGTRRGRLGFAYGFSFSFRLSYGLAV